MSRTLFYNFIQRLIFIPLFLSAPVWAATSHPLGGSGNFTSTTADILPRDDMMYYAYMGMDDFYLSGNRLHEMQINTGFYWGLSENIEAGVGLSVANNTATVSAGSGLRYLRFYGKYRFYGSRADGRAASLAFYSTTGELVGTPNLTSGETNSGFEANYSQFDAAGETHYAFAMDNRDINTYSGGFLYTLAPVVGLSASRMFYTRTPRVYELGLRAESATVANQAEGNVYLTLAAHFNPSAQMNYVAGALLDVPGGIGALKARYFFGFNYRNRYPRMQSAPPSAVKPEVAPAAAPAPVAESPPVVPADPVGCRAQVEVLDVSGLSGLGQRVANRLRTDGYCVTAIHVERDTLGYYSQVYYREGMAETAAGLVKAYRLQGSVSQRLLPTGVDLRLIVGRDQQ